MEKDTLDKAIALERNIRETIEAIKSIEKAPSHASIIYQNDNDLRTNTVVKWTPLMDELIEKHKSSMLSDLRDQEVRLSKELSDL